MRHHDEEHVADLTCHRQFRAEIAGSGSEGRMIVATHYALSSENTVQPVYEHSNLSYCFSNTSLHELLDWTGVDLVSH